MEEINRSAQQFLSTNELTEIYFYLGLVGNLGLVRRILMHDVFKGRENMVLNYNPHPPPRAGIGQIICSKKRSSSG